MSDSESETKAAQLEPELRDMKLEGAAVGASEGNLAGQVKAEDDADSLDRTPTPLSAVPSRLKSQSRSQSPAVKKHEADAASPGSSLHEETLGGDITLMAEPGRTPKLSRTASQKIIARPPPVYLDLPDSTDAARDTFVVLPECTYANKQSGSTEPAFECDCNEEWNAATKINEACGEDSDCINRATKMECSGGCRCGRKCQNQRFQRKQYADGQSSRVVVVSEPY
jgi:hypothetical protein